MSLRATSFLSDAKAQRRNNHFSYPDSQTLFRAQEFASSFTSFSSQSMSTTSLPGRFSVEYINEDELPTVELNRPEAGTYEVDSRVKKMLNRYEKLTMMEANEREYQLYLEQKAEKIKQAELAKQQEQSRLAAESMKMSKTVSTRAAQETDGVFKDVNATRAMIENMLLEMEPHRAKRKPKFVDQNKIDASQQVVAGSAKSMSKQLLSQPSSSPSPSSPPSPSSAAAGTVMSSSDVRLQQTSKDVVPAPRVRPLPLEDNEFDFDDNNIFGHERYANVPQAAIDVAKRMVSWRKPLSAHTACNTPSLETVANLMRVSQENGRNLIRQKYAQFAATRSAEFAAAKSPRSVTNPGTAKTRRREKERQKDVDGQENRVIRESITSLIPTPSFCAHRKSTFCEACNRNSNRYKNLPVPDSFKSTVVPKSPKASPIKSAVNRLIQQRPSSAPAVQPKTAGTNFEVVIDKARKLIVEGKYDDTITILDKVLAGKKMEGEQGAEMYFLRGEAKRLTGFPAEAESDIDFSLQLRANHYGALMALGLAQLDQGFCSKACRHFQQALSLNDTADVRFHLGRCLVYCREYETAIGHLTASIKKHPHNAPAYFCRGTAFEALGRKEAAFSDFDRVLLVDPDFERPYLERLKEAQRYGDEDEIEETRQILEKIGSHLSQQV
eukprot:GILJ01006704.1.p1 GENE.GILJ01006704.1~~GILJ01006704.1.p1  ORF type:complete len:667 (+),score=97.87 GILJ01006704.1:121-2121(+)